MKKISLTIISLFSLLLSQVTMAHFHYELPLQNELVTNTKNELTGLNIDWVYDGDLSDLMLKDQKDVTKMGAKLISDLDTLGYFTFVKLNGKSVDTAKVTKYKVEELKETDHSKLKLSFYLPLKTPVSLDGKNTLEFRHEDANASAILYYDKPENLQLASNLKEKCEVVITEVKDFEEGEAPQKVKVVCK